MKKRIYSTVTFTYVTGLSNYNSAYGGRSLVLSNPNIFRGMGYMCA